MDTISMAAAAVTGARHQRASRNGQDAVAMYRDAARGIAVVVVADGCGSGEGSEVGARLGARLFARALGTRLVYEPVDWLGTWEKVRAELVSTIALLAGYRAEEVRLDGGPIHDEVLREQFLFTIVAAAVTPEGAAVWALGDGAYMFGDGASTRVLGPFANNQPPYVAYDLLGDAREAHFEVAPSGCDTIVIATDGACDGVNDDPYRGGTGRAGLERFATERNLSHPDALRRELALLARSEERIDWDARRIMRTPAALQDDCAVGVLRWRRTS